jgi:hypothetical protein
LDTSTRPGLMEEMKQTLVRSHKIKIYHICIGSLQLFWRGLLTYG